MELTSLKVKIGLNSNGEADYPDFNTLECVKSSGLDWSKYVDTKGIGWHYDKTSGHKEETTDSPFGQQFGVLLVPEEFTTQAVKTFPGDCSRLNETETEDFYNNKVTIKMPDSIINDKVISAITAKQAAKLNLTNKENKALDSGDDTPGITKNHMKIFSDMKTKKGITIK